MTAEKNDNTHENPYKAPAGYFDKLPDRILERIDAGGQTRAHDGRVISMPARIGWAAAAVISLLAVFWLVTKDPAAPTSDELIARLTDKEIIDYLVTSEISLEDIMADALFDPAVLDSLEMETMPSLDLDSAAVNELYDLYDLEDLENS